MSSPHVPALRFDAFAAFEAGLPLLLPNVPPIPVVLFDGGVGPALCEVDRAPDAPLSIRRRGPIGLAVRAGEGTTFRALRVGGL